MLPLDLSPNVGASPGISGEPNPVVPGPAVGAPVRARDGTAQLGGKPVACPRDGGIEGSMAFAAMARMGRVAALRLAGVRGDDGLRFQGDTA